MTDRASSKSYEALGDYVRSQRELAQLSLRQAAELARISNPYLSQIEHGLALPSITVLNGLADDDEQDAELRKTAKAVATALQKRANTK